MKYYIQVFNDFSDENSVAYRMVNGDKKDAYKAIDDVTAMANVVNRDGNKVDDVHIGADGTIVTMNIKENSNENTKITGSENRTG